MGINQLERIDKLYIPVSVFPMNLIQFQLII